MNNIDINIWLINLKLGQLILIALLYLSERALCYLIDSFCPCKMCNCFKCLLLPREDVSNHVESKSPEQSEYHYNLYFIKGNIGKGMLIKNVYKLAYFKHVVYCTV